MFGSTQKIRSTVNDFRFNRKIPLFWCKMISVAIFTSKYFWTQTRKEREREKRNRNPETDSDEPRYRLRRTQKLTSLNPENPRPSSFIEQCPNPFVKPRKPIWSHHLRPSSRRSHHRWDRHTPAPIHPKPIVLVLFLLGIKNLGFVSFGFWWIWFLSSTQLRHPRPRFVVPDPASLSPFIKPCRLSFSLSQFDRVWWIFFVGICFFCVYLPRNDINICLEDEKMWKNVRNMIKMGFLEHFQEYNQTPENIFQNIFWNATKHLKIFSFPENSISGK